jgi:hypothetical protein
MEAGGPITQEGILDSSRTRTLLGAAAFAETKVNLRPDLAEEKSCCD